MVSFVTIQNKLTMNLTTDQKRYLEEWMSFLRIPSVSADPTQKEAVRQAADWVKNALDKV